MHHRRRQAVAVVAQDLQQALVGVAFMEKDRQLQVDGQGQVLFEYFFLLWPRRKITIEVEPAFTHGAHLRLAQQGPQLAGAVAVPAAGIVRVDAGGAEQALAALIQLAA
ncbi:hypothetical protein D3C71_1843720 [compost metagenome]